MFQRHRELFEKELYETTHTSYSTSERQTNVFLCLFFHAGTKSDTSCVIESGGGKDLAQGRIIPFCLVTGVLSLELPVPP